MSKKKPKKPILERAMINGKRYTKTFHRLVDAVKWKDEMDQERLVTKSSGGSYSGILMSDVCIEYLNTRIGTKEGTKETYESVIKNYILPTFGRKKMRELKKSDAIKLIGLMEADKKAASTINKIMVILKCITKFAVENEYLDISPFATIKPLKVDVRKFDYWTQKQAQDFLVQIKDNNLFPIIKFALNTGLRRGELCGLLWDNVKVNEGNTELHFNEQLLPGRRRDLVKGHTMRFVPLTQSAIEILDKLGRRADEAYIFTMPNGKSIEPNYLSIQFKKIQAAIGIPINKQIKLHATRHSFASLLSAKGINLQKIQHLLGHKDSKVTERYSHLSQNELRNTVQIVSFTE